MVGDTVWVAARRDAKIVRLNGQTRTDQRRSLAVGANPQDVATVGDGAAITTTTSPTEHRGGTLTIAGASEDGLRERPSVDPDSFDAWYPVVWDSLTVTNDGLVSLKRVPGPDGGTVVADLAKALPTITDGGLTYAFQLREGIRYSTGRPVRAGDIRHGLERTFTVNAALLPQVSATLGRGAVRRDRRRADMPGVPEVVRPQPRDRGGRQDREDHVSSATSRSRLPRETRHATRGRYAPGGPSARLRSPPVACHRPVHDHPLRHLAVRPRTQPVLPRMVTGRATRRIPRSHRLPGLQEDQPGGFRGRARRRRLALLHDSSQQRSRPTRSKPNYAAQTHPSAYPATDVLVIEPNSPLNRDRSARHAIAYAIDRDRLHSILNSGSSSVPAPSTCQLVPPNSPGYRPYCPYKLDPARAQKLVHRSPSYGKPVSVLSYVRGRTPAGTSSNF